MDWLVEMHIFRAGHVFKTVTVRMYFKKWAYTEQVRRLKENVNTCLMMLYIEIYE